MSNRLLNPSLIPESLWETQGQLIVLPAQLVDAYLNILNQRQLIELANSRDRNNPPVGGLTQDLADKHFAQAFDGSAARALLAVLDPLDELPHVSDTFVQALAGNQVCLIDAPCGAGATAYAFLTAFAELRAIGVVPRMPLDIMFIGADLSDPSRQYASEFHPQITARLEEQAIFVQSEFLSWDVTNAMSTTFLIQNILGKSLHAPKRLLLVANFNAFLEKAKKRKVAEPQLEELFRFCSGPNCSALWIEPNMNVVTQPGGTFHWLKSMASGVWRYFIRVIGVSNESDLSHSTSAARFREPLDPEVTPRVQVAVVPISLERRT